ncbi:PLP-dependent transferase [Aaosphaeria arxii CBS 175.79]|uniref:PLP-dependent transferase n=1 Tax=Aaosphaeria arxii CBS 175.79 TaxID=1450172 RepID=A0A6A5XFG3_9PLEO|nr:PLP-dependent transferase [Aaosphaeria arxii CBS 175.79]KAF2011114.1 PLP-dependent transferase [Aaosphaeria arxii CBS 175.79]
MPAFSDVAGSLTSTKPLINLLRGSAFISYHYYCCPVAIFLLRFALLWPNFSLLPKHILQKATNTVLANHAIADPGLEYGPDPGDLKLRKNVASLLTNFYHFSNPISEDRVCITGGASQNLACLLQVFTDPVYTRNVWIVAPSYMLAFRIFDDSGFSTKLRAVPEDEEGIDLEFLKREIQKSEEKAEAEGNNRPIFKPARPWGKVYKHVIYCVPTFSNPSFKTMTVRRREGLVRLAREYDALIISDDVYDFLRFPSSLTAETLTSEKANVPRIVDVDRTLDGGAEREGADGFGNAASNGSFSKICGPGLRTGWLEGTAKMAYGVSQTGSSRSGGAPSQLTATFVAEALETGELQRHIFDVLQPAYALRYRKMVAAITKYLTPLGVKIPQTDREVVGGYFIWLTLPQPLKGAVVAQRAKDDENVIVAQGEIFEVPNDTQNAHFENCLRVCFAWEDEDLLAEGIERLANVIRALLSEEQRQEGVKAKVATREGMGEFM